MFFYSPSVFPDLKFVIKYPVLNCSDTLFQCFDWRIHLDLAKVPCLKELTSPYIISYLHFLNLNNILTLPKLSPSLKLCLIWCELMFTLFFTCQIYGHACYFTKTKQMQAVYLFIFYFSHGFLSNTFGYSQSQQQWEIIYTHCCRSYSEKVKYI